MFPIHPLHKISLFLCSTPLPRQGLLKSEVKELRPSQYNNWHKHPERFELDGHAPVREMWHRASLAWRKILAPETEEALLAAAAARAAAAAGGGGVGSSAAAWAGLSAGPSSRAPHQSAASRRDLLVVAHNNTNQALISTALCLPCTLFRCCLWCHASPCALFSASDALQGTAFPVHSPWRHSAHLLIHWAICIPECETPSHQQEAGPMQCGHVLTAVATVGLARSVPRCEL